MADEDDDSLDDMLLEAAGRTRGTDRRTPARSSLKRSRHMEETSSDDERSDSKSNNDDDDDESDDDDDLSGRPSGSRMPLKKRFDAADKDEDDDDGEGYDSDLSFGSDLYKDEEDRARLAAMTELDREMILHDRAEARENFLMRKRAEARQKRESGVKPRERDQAAPSSRMRSSLRDSSRSVKENALNELVAKRQKAYDTDMQRRRRDVAKRELSPVRKKGQESSFSTSDSDSSGEDISSRDEVQEDERAPSDDDREDGGNKLTVDDIKIITIQRSTLLKWFREPFFEDIIIGCFVRISIGMSKDGQSTYRLCQVKNVDARNPHKQYKFGSRMTHKYLNCVWASDASAARWSMTVVSDDPPTGKEFEEWEDEVSRCGARMISMAEISEKKEAIAKLSSFVYSASLVKQMLQEKKMATSRPSNIAAERDRLLKEIALADSKGEDLEVERLHARLKDIEVYASQNQSKDSKALALAEMNRRNRYENFKNASDLKPVNTMARAGDAGYDPFSRRWTRSQNYYMRKANSPEAVEDASGEATTAAAQEAAADAGKLVDTNAPVDDTTKLFSLHNFQLHISLVGIQKFGGAQGAHLAFIARKQRLEATCGVQVASNDGRRHSLTLTVNDYKRRRGLL